MKNTKNYRLKKAIFIDEYTFTDDAELFFGKGARIEWDENSFNVYINEEYIPVFDVKRMLSEYFDVTVTSIHTDEFDIIGIWIVYVEEQIMVITKERADELGFITTREDCVNCGICREENGKLYCDETGLCIDDKPNDVECPELDEERLRMEMTDEEYDAYRHNRLKVEEE